MPKIVIEVRGGVVSAAYTDTADTDIIVVDWDNDTTESLYSLWLRRMPEETAKEVDMFESETLRSRYTTGD
jgi:hypothetical protein